MNKKYFSRITSLLLAVFVAFGMIGFNTGEVSAASRFMLGMGDVTYVDQNPGVYLYDSKGKIDDVKIYSVKSSNSKVGKVVKDSWKDDKDKTHVWFNLMTKKPGKVTLTIKYKNAKGKKATMKKKITVKAYPKEVKKLTINGKKVNTKDYKYFFRKKCKTTKPKIKLATAKGWTVVNVYAWAYPKSGAEKKVKLTKSMLKSGKAFKFPKGYESEYITIDMVNKKGDLISYDISLYR